MGCELKEHLDIAVKGGDALAENRLTGKSNTGTYFVSSTSNFDEYSRFFSSAIQYRIKRSGVAAYLYEASNIYSDVLRMFPKTWGDFYYACKQLLNLKTDPISPVELRINDARVFLKFSNNSQEGVVVFRELLYANISSIRLELDNNVCYISPVFNTDKCYEMVKGK